MLFKIYIKKQKLFKNYKNMLKDNLKILQKIKYEQFLVILKLFKNKSLLNDLKF